MIDLLIRLPDNTTQTIQTIPGITAQNIIKDIRTENPILACFINNEPERLDTPIIQSCTIDLFDMRNNYANMSYQSGLTLLYLEAIRCVLGDVKVTIENSLSKGLFTTVKMNVTDEIVEEIHTKMKELVKKDLPFYESPLSYKELLKQFSEKKRYDTVSLLQSSPHVNNARMVAFGETQDVAYIHQLPSSKYFTDFELVRYRHGIILRFPTQSHPSSLLPYEEQKLLYEAFAEESQWEKLMGVKYAADLNHAMSKDRKEIYMMSEALHEKKIANIAERIKQENKRIILIAGPSSSGKTSFAKRLCIQLQVAGLKPLYLGTDDYFVDRKYLVPDKNGDLDFETIKAVDIELFTAQMNDLLAGKSVDIPQFDFITGEKIFGNRITKIDNTMPIVIEGIHALNPEMTKGIADSEKFKLYISPLTSLNIDAHHRVPTTDARMLRRLVRDYRTRARSAQNTIHDWASVRRGEDQWIFPFCLEADAFFNSSTIYELSVLKKYAEPLLRMIPRDAKEYPEAMRMLAFLQFFKIAEDDSEIANNSIIREFIGGSILID